MLREASVGEIKRGRIVKAQGQLVICMRHYPRGLKRSLCHEYVRALAPDADLFGDFREALEKLKDHDQAFDAVAYEMRFGLSAPAFAELRRLSELSLTKDVFLICQCERGEKCHRDLLLLLGNHLFDVPTDRVKTKYPIFMDRMNLLRLPLE